MTTAIKHQKLGVGYSLNNLDDRWVMIFEVLSDKTRLRMFRKLIFIQGLCTTELSKAFAASLPVASYHLKQLEMAGLVRKERRGRMICYYIRNEDALVKKVARLVAER